MHYYVWNRQLVEAATLHREFSLVLYDDLEPWHVMGEWELGVRGRGSMCTYS